MFLYCLVWLQTSLCLMYMFISGYSMYVSVARLELSPRQHHGNVGTPDSAPTQPSTISTLALSLLIRPASPPSHLSASHPIVPTPKGCGCACSKNSKGTHSQEKWGTCFCVFDGIKACTTNKKPRQRKNHRPSWTCVANLKAHQAGHTRTTPPISIDGQASDATCVGGKSRWCSCSNSNNSSSSLGAHNNACLHNASQQQQHASNSTSSSCIIFLHGRSRSRSINTFSYKHPGC